MKFSVDKKIFAKFPDYQVGVVVATGLDNSRSQEETFELLKGETTDTRERLKEKPLNQWPHIKAWRNAFKKVSISPTKFAPSADALLRRLSKGQLPPNINPIINITNTLAMKHSVSMGGHDLDKTKGDIQVRPAKAGDTFKPMSSTKTEKVEQEFVYADTEEILTRKWVWRQGEKSKTDTDTKNIFIPVDALPPVDEDKLQEIMDELCALITSHLGGKTTIFIVNKDNPTIALPVLAKKIKKKKVDKIDEVLTRGVEKIYPSRAALEKVLRSGKKIRLYQGFDPSMANLHLGNMVGLLKLKQFQELGHEVIFLVGDFTGMIGDPTDKSAARKLLTREQVLANAKNWREQAGRLLNFSGKNPTKMLFNSQWLDKVSFKDLIEITAHFTAQQMLERDFFQRRIKEKKAIFLHEFLYPVAQAIDCVKMDVDLEVGGSDQTFNMLAGRKLMKVLKGKEKFVLTTKLLVDSKGEKVGKTAGNALFLNAKPADMYGGIMSFPDEVIILGFELLTTLPLRIIELYKKELEEDKVNPMDLKKKLAFEIVKINYGEEVAGDAQGGFERVFQKRKLPKKVKSVKLKVKSWNIVDLLMETKLCKSRSEAKRLIGQGAVEIDRSRIKNQESRIKIKDEMIIRVGKRRFVRICL